MKVLDEAREVGDWARQADEGLCHTEIGILYVMKARSEVYMCR